MGNATDTQYPKGGWAPYDSDRSLSTLKPSTAYEQGVMRKKLAGLRDSPFKEAVLAWVDAGCPRWDHRCRSELVRVAPSGW